MNPKTNRLHALLSLNRVPSFAWVLLCTCFVTLHLVVEPLFATFLVTMFFGLFTALCLFVFLHVFLLFKNRSFWHNAVLDRDPIVIRSTGMLLILIAIFYILVLALQAQNYMLS